jgi:hypothetical protein
MWIFLSWAALWRRRRPNYVRLRYAGIIWNLWAIAEIAVPGKLVSDLFLWNYK